MLRATLLESGEAVIGSLAPGDLQDAEVFIGSSLRGLARAELQCASAASGR